MLVQYHAECKRGPDLEQKEIPRFAKGEKGAYIRCSQRTDNEHQHQSRSCAWLSDFAPRHIFSFMLYVLQYL